MEQNLQKKKKKKDEGKTLRKNHCSIRKNTIRNNHFIQELTPRIPPAMTNSAKNLLLGLKIIIWLCVLFSLAKPLASNNCCKSITSLILSSTFLQIYCTGLIGPISYSIWIWATICDHTIIYNINLILIIQCKHIIVIN